MKKILIGLICAFAMMACEDSAISSGREIYQMYFKKYLKDPSSFVVYSEKYQKESNHTVKWTIDYGAKNGFGAMTREEVSFTTTSNLIDINGNIYKKSELK